MKALDYSDTSKEDVTRQAQTRVCMLTLERSSAEIRMIRAATALADAGLAVSIVDIQSESHDKSGTYGSEDIPGIKMKHIVMPSWFVPTRFKPWFLVKVACAFIRSTFCLLQIPADIYHVHNDLALPAGYIVARLRRKPLIFEPHELTLSDPGLKRWRRLHALATRLLNYMLPYCSAVIVVSPPILQEMQDIYHASRVLLLRSVPEYRAVAKMPWPVCGGMLCKQPEKSSIGIRRRSFSLRCITISWRKR